MVPPQVATIDFHVTSECSQECPYCWGPQDFEHPVDTKTALRIVDRVREVGARRIVFTGGDPLTRPDIETLILHAKDIGLEVAVSTTGDELTKEFLEKVGASIDLVSLPLDGSTAEINDRTKEEGHFAAVMRALRALKDHTEIDVKICTPVTRHNLTDVPNILQLIEDYARTTKARVFYNIFQTYPRAMGPVDWNELLISDGEFQALRSKLAGQNSIRVNFLDHETLDRLYVLVFPDGSLVIPRGPQFLSYGAFLEVEDLRAALTDSRFDSDKHVRHSRAWEKG